MGSTSRIDWAMVRLGFIFYEDALTMSWQGIGLEEHESPYLRGGSDDIIETGHTFSNEPGVYIEGKVRLPRSILYWIGT